MENGKSNTQVYQKCASYKPSRGRTGDGKRPKKKRRSFAIERRFIDLAHAPVPGLTLVAP